LIHQKLCDKSAEGAALPLGPDDCADSHRRASRSVHVVFWPMGRRGRCRLGASFADGVFRPAPKTEGVPSPIGACSDAAGRWLIKRGFERFCRLSHDTPGRCHRRGLRPELKSGSRCLHGVEKNGQRCPRRQILWARPDQ
jgi:hypothetical protein